MRFGIVGAGKMGGEIEAMASRRGHDVVWKLGSRENSGGAYQGCWFERSRLGGERSAEHHLAYSEAQVRRFLDAMRRHVQHLRVTGVIFFDKVHGQIGGSRNGVELHPVLDVERGAIR